MKKLLLMAVMLLSFGVANATYIVSCTSGGQMFVLTMSGGTITGWASAGLCGGGPWVTEFDNCPACEGRTVDVNLTNNLHDHWNVSEYSNDVPQDIKDMVMAKIAAGEVKHSIIDVTLLTSEQQAFYASH